MLGRFREVRTGGLLPKRPEDGRGKVSNMRISVYVNRDVALQAGLDAYGPAVVDMPSAVSMYRNNSGSRA